MGAKLTLRLDPMIVTSAKIYAKSNRKSLSKIVEDFFRGLVYESRPSKKYPPLIERLSGVISEKDLEKIYSEDERVEYILGE